MVFSDVVLSEEAWRQRRKAHEARVDRWITPHLERRRRGIAHPVEDFLFTYYSYRPAALRRWHPGIGATLTGDVLEWRSVKGYAVVDGRAALDAGHVAGARQRAEWIRTLLSSTKDRPPMLGCFGLHEWAMVHRRSPEQLRHSAYPLRLGPAGTDAVVESHRIACTHFDAFRFFTESARPLNVVQPTRETQPQHEQPGCLHATMDLYKWAYKLSPLTPSDLVADCFALARDVRVVDMRAAPYDLSSLGVVPIRIETAPGKAEYITAQRGFVGRAQELRSRLIDVCDRLVASGRHARVGG
jgi:hypothetical protein